MRTEVDDAKRKGIARQRIVTSSLMMLMCITLFLANRHRTGAVILWIYGGGVIFFLIVAILSTRQLLKQSGTRRSPRTLGGHE